MSKVQGINSWGKKMSKQDLIQKFNTKYKGKTITATELPEFTNDVCAILFEKLIIKCDDAE